MTALTRVPQNGTLPGQPRVSAAANLSPVDKAAILMMLFGEEVASEILKSLSPSEVQALGGAMYGLSGVSHATVNAVLEEVFERLRTQSGLGVGASQFVRTILNDALGSTKAQSVLSRITPASSDRPIEILDWMDASSIAELIHDEHPQIVALVVAALDPAQAAEVLRLLPEEIQPEIVQRIAQLTTVQPEALRDLEDVMQRKFNANTTLRSSQIGGIKAAARILNFTRQDMESRVLRDIRKEDKVLMEALQDNMFVFENLVKSDDRALQTLLREIDTEQLVLALKGADEAVRDRLLSCVSARAAANIRDEMEALGPVRLSVVQEAQKQIIAIARRMADEDKITLAGRGGEKMV
ncbi:flagellar motor switch protein FliG [Roseicyclus mahoneyensis]|uniref:Flagellar motor switch protein FliG n=1 Tax=Roseicyclus mahoneyensis TaxID=164332 RepID=A0A316GH51_9RHOB|nr:flagellar motor switch protein FliG [Roseicyclus mahoneyensis]PWK60393.1 flagellar motor switch protein FliG [Roseicyclus mahoneyensis]